jgi:hypothetical protein
MGVPPGVQQAVQKYQQLAESRTIPGQEIVEGNIKGATASGINRIMDISRGGEALGAVSQIVAGEQEQMSDLGVTAAQMARDAEYRLAGSYEGLGRWQQMAWDWNKRGRYQEGMDLFGAGAQNLFGAGQAGTSMGVALLDKDNAGSLNTGNINQLIEALTGLSNNPQSQYDPVLGLTGD